MLACTITVNKLPVPCRIIIAKHRISNLTESARFQGSTYQICLSFLHTSKSDNMLRDLKGKQRCVKGQALLGVVQCCKIRKTVLRFGLAQRVVLFLSTHVACPHLVFVWSGGWPNIFFLLSLRATRVVCGSGGSRRRSQINDI